MTDEPGEVWLAGEDEAGFGMPSGVIAEAEDGDGGDRIFCSFPRVALVVNVAHEVFRAGSTLAIDLPEGQAALLPLM